MWPRLDVTSSNRPVLLTDEHIVFVQQGVGLYDGEDKVEHCQDGSVYLTTHRICYIDKLFPKKYACFVRLADVSRHELTASFLTSSPKAILYLNDQADPQDNTQRTWICRICYFSNPFPLSGSNGQEPPPCLTCGMRPEPAAWVAAGDAMQPASSKPGSPVGDICPRCTFHNHPSLFQCEMCGEVLREKPTEQHTPSEVLKVAFRSGGDQLFYSHLCSEVAARAWNVPAVSRAEISTGAGIAGLEQASADIRKHNEVALARAFEDLEAMKKRAKEIVQLAERFAAMTAPETDMDSPLHPPRALDIISSHVTREMTGDAFHAELARQLVEFLENGLLKKHGGIITLHDLFAYYNRARSVDMVSPHDVFEAVSRFDELNMPLRLRAFNSGLLVVHDAQQTEQAVHKAVFDYLQHNDYISPRDASQNFGWSIAVAKEELELFEAQGLLCRDISVAGHRFYINTICSVLQAPA